MSCINQASKDYKNPFIDLKFFNENVKFNFESPIITHAFNLMDFISKYSTFQSGIAA